MHLLPAALAYSRTNPLHKGVSSLATVAKTKVTETLYHLTAAILFRALLASGQFVTRGVDRWLSLVEMASKNLHRKRPFPHDVGDSQIDQWQVSVMSSESTAPLLILSTWARVSERVGASA
jgi:hypothetical protein